MVVVVFLFTDANFRNELFNRGAGATKVTVPFTASSIIGPLGNVGGLINQGVQNIVGSSGIPANAPNTGSAKIVNT
jgi:hypothetical protein